MRNFTNLCTVLAGSLFLASCGGGGGGGSTGGGGGSVSTPAPTVSLSASSSDITQGESVTLSWSSTNATSCSASGSWSGSKDTSGNEEVTESSAGDYSYSLSCSGAGGSRSASAAVTVERLIKIDPSDITYRLPQVGDIFVTEADVTQRDYSYGGALVSEQTLEDFTSDSEYFSSSLSNDEVDLLTENGYYPLMLQSTDASGDISRSERAIRGDSEYIISNDSSGKHYTVRSDGTLGLGSIRKLPLVSGESYTEQYRIYGPNLFTEGTQTFTISNIEIVDTPLGKIEAFKVSVTDQSIERDTTGGFNVLTQAIDVNRIDWIHPKIGIVRSEANGRFDSSDVGTLFENEYSRLDGVAVIREVNFALPE